MLPACVITRNHCHALLSSISFVMGLIVLTCSCCVSDREAENTYAPNEPIVSLWDYNEPCFEAQPESLLWAVWPDGFVVVRSKSGELMSTFIDAQIVKDLKRKIKRVPLLNEESRLNCMYGGGLTKILIVKHPEGTIRIERPIVDSTSPSFLAFVVKWEEFENIINNIKLSNLQKYDNSRPYAFPPPSPQEKSLIEYTAIP